LEYLEIVPEWLDVSKKEENLNKEINSPLPTQNHVVKIQYDYQIFLLIITRALIYMHLKSVKYEANMQLHA
jgi:hypothetical protein